MASPPLPRCACASTLWYVALLALTVLLLAAFLHFQLERRLIASTDAVLAVTATQMLSVLDEEGGRPLFEPRRVSGRLPARLDEDSFAARLLAPDGGEVWSGLGDFARSAQCGAPTGVQHARRGRRATGACSRSRSRMGAGWSAGWRWRTRWKAWKKRWKRSASSALGAPDHPAAGGRGYFLARPRAPPDRRGHADRRADQRQRPVAAAELRGARRRGGAAGAHL